MRSRKENFIETAAAILARYCTQNALPLPSGEDLNRVGANLWSMMEIRGLPPLLAPDEMGAPGEMDAAEVAPLINAALAGVSDSEGREVPVRQLVKACFHPEFKKCRESYRELSPDGTCRRQQLDRALARVSGSHCVDCPYWTALTPAQHEICLRADWRSDVRAFEDHREIFLPEDFRALRRLVRERARKK